MTQSTDCLFCKMISGQMKVPKVYEDDSFIAIRDISPQAKVHLLLIPKLHVASLDDAFPAQGPGQNRLLGNLFEVATQVARQQGLLPGGFRSVMNTLADGGQTVFHLHLHLLGGEKLL